MVCRSCLIAFHIAVLSSLVVSAAFPVPVMAADEGVSSVIIATDAHYPDMMIAGVAGNTLGIPLLVTSPGDMPADTESEIEAMGADTIYIVGGPAVVSESLEDRLSQTYTVARLWGMTRYGTAVQVVMNFWESAPRVLLVRDILSAPSLENSSLVSEAKDLAIQEEMPMLLIHNNYIPSQVIEALSNLSVSEVIIVGNVGDRVTSTLADMGITVSEHIKGPDVNETRRLLRERIKLKVRQRTERPLVVVAVGNWSDTIKVPYVPNGTSRHISGESQIDDLISEIQDIGYSRIIITGKPDLAGLIFDRLAAAGINATLIPAGTVARVAAQVMRMELVRIRLRAAAVKLRLTAMNRRMVMAALNDSSSVLSSVDSLLDRAGVSAEVKNRVMTALRQIKQDMDRSIAAGNYTKALVYYKKLKEMPERLALQYRARLAAIYQNLLDRETGADTALESLRRLRNATAARAGGR